MGWVNFLDKYKRAWKLESSETRGLIITAVLLSFIVSFREWGTVAFDYEAGLANYARAFVIVTISLLVHEAGHRAIASMMGYKSRYKTWILGLVIGLIIAFLSNGHVWFLAPGFILVAHTFHRLG
ncbi:hypothetical protein ACFL0V_06940, partial [Nanoarchaeota archaeon]